MVDRIACRLVLVLALCLLVIGCSGESSAPGAAADSTTASTAVPANAAPVSRASQLHGTWICESEAELAGIEFLDGDKVMLMYGPRGADILTMDYSVIDNGRVRMTGPGGMTMVFSAKVSGDRMELTEASEPDQPEQFRRLRSEETMAAALQAKQERLAREAREREERMREHAEGLAKAAAERLMHTHSVVAPADPQMANLMSVALEIEHLENNQFSGFAYFEQPGRKHTVTGQVGPRAGTDQAFVQMQFGNQVDPQPQAIPRPIVPSGQPGNFATATGPPDVAKQTTGVTLTFEVTGDVEAPQFAGTGALAGNRPLAMTLTTDEALHDRMVEALAAEHRLRAKKRAPITDLIKDHAYLAGVIAERGQHLAIGISLRRQEDSQDYTADVWQVQHGVNGRRANIADVRAAIDVSGVFPRLTLTGRGVNYQFDQIDTAGRAFSGLMNVGGGQQGITPISVRVIEAWSQEEFAHELAAREALAAGGLTESTRLRGLIQAGRLPYHDTHIPVEFTLVTTADGKVTGNASFPSVVAEAEIAGEIVATPAGPTILLQIGSGQGTPDTGIPVLQRLQTGHLQLTILRTNPLQLTGSFFFNNVTNVPTSSFDVALTGYDEARAEDFRKRIDEKFREALILELAVPRGPRGMFARAVFKRDPQSGMIAGKLDENGQVIYAGPPAFLLGERSQVNGWDVLNLQTTYPPDTPSRGYDMSYQLWFTEYGPDLRLAGTGTSNGRGHTLVEFVELPAP